LIAWAGDSRIYALLSNRTMSQLTEDHLNERGEITKFIRGDGVIPGGVQVRQFNMDQVLAVAATTDGIHDRCSFEELRLFITYCVSNRLRDPAIIVGEMLAFLGANISDNVTLALMYERR